MKNRDTSVTELCKELGVTKTKNFGNYHIICCFFIFSIYYIKFNKRTKMKILAIIILSIGLLFGAVDINTADKKELMSLNGIGAKKAEAIIKHRKENCFKNVNSLSIIKGIGNKTIEKNRDNLEASKCEK